MRNLNPIPETSYLTSTNYKYYRNIMRIFYKQYEKMHFQIRKEDVFEIIKSYPEFSQYSMEQLKLDLDALVEWGNLIATQDSKRVYTIADYKNRQFKYSMSEYAVEIERMTVNLENLFMEKGNLSTNLFTRINDTLEQLQKFKLKSYKEINELWKSLQQDFKTINHNYQDYLRKFYSDHEDKILKSVEFILYKDSFISDLKTFIRKLQLNSLIIENTLKKIDKNTESQLLESVIKSELKIPRTLSERTDKLEMDITENVLGKWEAFKRWFLSYDGKQSESYQVLEVTNEIITKITGNAALLVQLQNWGINRKNDYKKFITMFLNCKDTDEAHKLSSHIFGIQNIEHFKINADRTTDSINSSTYDEDAIEFCLKPHSRKYRPRRDKTGFESKSYQKSIQKEQYLEQLSKNREVISKYIKNNRLIIAEIEDCISPTIRTILLRWISEANIDSYNMGRTEYGQEYKLIKNNGKCILHCEDGDLEMPQYIFEFKENLDD